MNENLKTWATALRTRGAIALGAAAATLAAVLVLLAGLGTAAAHGAHPATASGTSDAHPAPTVSSDAFKPLANLGFTPDANGYSFPNYGPGFAGLTPVQMQWLFGSAVCVSGSGSTCVLTPPAARWVRNENTAMLDGHCEGFSVSSLMMFRKLVSPKDFGAGSIRGLKLKGNTALQSFIAYAYAYQALTRVYNDVVWDTTPMGIVHHLIHDLRNRQREWSIHIFMPNGSGGHSVTPTGVVRLGHDVYGIRIYDNNWPGRIRTIRVNARTDAWRYQATINPHVKAALYTGTAKSDTLQLENMSPGIGKQPCPFCKRAGKAGPRADAIMASAATGGSHRAAAGDTTVSLEGSEVRGGHSRVLITDAHGRKLGDTASGRLVDQIPGAAVEPMTSGGVTPWTDAPEPQYELPADTPLSLKLSGGSNDSSTPESLSIIGAGSDVGIDNLHSGNAGSATVGVTSDLSGVSYHNASGGPQTPTLSLGSTAPGTDHEFAVTANGFGGSGTLDVSVDSGTGQLVIAPTGGGTTSVDVSVEELESDGIQQTFTHDDVPVKAGTTASVDYGQWSGGSSPMPIDNGGTTTSATNQDPDPTTTGTTTTTSTSTSSSSAPTSSTTATTSTTSETTTSSVTTSTASSGGGFGSPGPEVTGISPDSVTQGQASDPVTITGSGFSAGDTLSFGDGVTASNVDVVSSSEITADLAAPQTAAPGTTSAAVTAPGGSPSPYPDGLDVLTPPNVTPSGVSAAYAQTVSSTSGLAAFFPLSSGYGDTVNGGPTLTNDGTTMASSGGVWNDGYASFPGDPGDGYLSLSSNPWADSQTFTWEGWVYWNGRQADGGDFERIFDFGSGESAYIMMTLDDGDGVDGLPRVDLSYGGEAYRGTEWPNPFPENSWQYIVVTEDGSGTVDEYDDGVSEVSQSVDITPAEIGSTSQTWLGRSQYPADDYLDGGEEDVALYTSPLTQDQVEDHYGASMPVSPSSAAPSDTVTLTINGSGFESGDTVSFSDSSDITAGATTYVSPSELTVQVQISPTAQDGTQSDVTVTDPDDVSSTAANAFTIGS